MISKKSVDEIFASARIVDVVDDFVQLKKRGANFVGNCPFHNEKTPSFTVSPARNIYKCFGCGRGGNSVQFVMEHEGFSFPEALRYLAKKFNIAIEENQPSGEYLEEKQLRDSLFIVNEFAKDFYKKNLHHTDLGKSVGLGYFKERGFLLKTIDKFELGYAQPGGDNLITSATNAGYNIEHLRQLGLVTQKDRDFFYKRVIFPIHNLSGKVVAFAGRILESNSKQPKYLNSRESEIYVKSKNLYGLYFARQAIRRQDYCLLVEGYTDVLSLHQNSIENVVASSGTSLTEGQIRLIKRYTKNIVILYDGDQAGVKAALRGVDLILDQDMDVHIVLLPEGEDPDSFVRKAGSKAFQEFITKEKKDFILFKAELVKNEAGKDPLKKAELINNIIESLAHVIDPIKRSVYVTHCCNLLGLDEQMLVRETNKQINKQIKQRRIEKLREIRQDHEVQRGVLENESVKQGTVVEGEIVVEKDIIQEKDILRVMLNYGQEIIDAEHELTVAEYILGEIKDIFEYFEHGGCKKVIEKCVNMVNQKQYNIQTLINSEDKEISELVVELLSDPFTLSENW